jgi:plasmid stability protein
MVGSTIQIRNVPFELRRRLKARAAAEGLSISDFVIRMLGKALDPASVIRAERDSR